mmetsp:Transcript_36667/g.88578  ORF Transcript_36667/g.88578 Transcript_36667/m.88578 type:complete len:254 (+) Transcript_36667:3039-3800(+)
MVSWTNCSCNCFSFSSSFNSCSNARAFICSRMSSSCWRFISSSSSSFLLFFFAPPPKTPPKRPFFGSSFFGGTNVSSGIPMISMVLELSSAIDSSDFLSGGIGVSTCSVLDPDTLLSIFFFFLIFLGLSLNFFSLRRCFLLSSFSLTRCSHSPRRCFFLISFSKSFRVFSTSAVFSFFCRRMIASSSSSSSSSSSFLFRFCRSSSHKNSCLSSRCPFICRSSKSWRYTESSSSFSSSVISLILASSLKRPNGC